MFNSEVVVKIIENKKDKNEGISLVDIKKIRIKGQFHQKHLSTCPAMPRFHTAFGEPSEI
jgi:hypothetical protein